MPHRKGRDEQRSWAKKIIPVTKKRLVEMHYLGGAERGWWHVLVPCLREADRWGWALWAVLLFMECSLSPKQFGGLGIVQSWTI